MFTALLAKIFGTNNARQLKALRPIVDHINSLEPSMKALTDEQMVQKTFSLKQQYQEGRSLDDMLPEAFALVREASIRTIGQRHFDVQLLGGIVLHQGKIAEMKTGEGKTLTATLPLYLNALSGKGVHLVTTNDYLARRDSEWMGRIFNHLGLTVSCLQHSMNDFERKEVYKADILYATNNELGFDYLRDNMKFRLEDYVQRPLNYAIVDEVDSILIDEARTPLIISGAAERSSKLYVDVDKAVVRLKRDVDYEVDEKHRSVQLTEVGNDKLEEHFNIENLYAIENIALLHHCNQALKAHAIFKRDVDYMVQDGEVLIIEFTGRVLSGRRYSDGLHQALEAKEHVEIERESHTLASITLQNYFRLYNKLAGMTGTAMTEAEEFYKIYKLAVISVPTNQDMIRIDKDDLIFLTKEAKYNIIAEDVLERHKKGQPVLIGTIAVETSELLSNVLKRHGIPRDVLNAKQHAREAEIVQHAGELGHVTIATNMAGRGTDIKLKPESIAAGGLYILGTERHESRRIDNQLRGRSGRQGDPGESRFYISLEDDLIRVNAGDSIKNKMLWAGMKEDEIIESKVVSKAIEYSQQKVEKNNFEVRKHLLEYDDVLNQQRKVIYGFRRDILEGEDKIYDLIRDMIAGAVQETIGMFCAGRALTRESVDGAYEHLAKVTGLPLGAFNDYGLNEGDVESFTTGLIEFLSKKYADYRDQEKIEVVRDAEKWLLLEVIDQAWKLHMVNLEHLKEGIGLRGYGQKNPLIEYKREAFIMFQDMMQQIKFDLLHHIFHLNLDRFDAHELEQKREKELMDLQLVGTEEGGVSHPKRPVARVAENKVGRNDACPCGSGQKFKKCHGK